MTLRPLLSLLIVSSALTGLATAATGRLVALSADPGPGWDRAVLGMVETSAGPLLLLDIAVLVAGPEPIAA